LKEIYKIRYVIEVVILKIETYSGKFDDLKIQMAIPRIIRLKVKIMKKCIK